MMQPHRYLENLVNTANPVRLVILLYDKAINSLKSAVEIMEKTEPSPEEIERKYKALGRAGDILAVLDGTLNFEKGGEIARQLHEIYEGLLNDLLRVVVQDDPQTVKRIIKVLENLRAAWVEAEISLKKKGRLRTPNRVCGEKAQSLAATL
ncbi:flagellar export chaperone FliS [Thermosulfurimonas sp.]|uniref:flagellar export chaperone FliS n=1 Tax=Thermosulfurimonas sp. TaxID=2080236 RepID=UPI0025F57BAE|nr:flagellar export chaperone FliS [Thermosulfurimonas sp.]